MDEAGIQRPAGSGQPAAAAPAQAAYLATWLALTCRGIPGALAGVVVVAGQEAGSFEVRSGWPDLRVGVRLTAPSERCLGTREVFVQNEAGVVVVATPLLEQGRLAGALVLEVALVPLSPREITTAAAAAAVYLNQIMLGNFSEVEQAGRADLQRQRELLRLVCQPGTFPAAALESVNWLATRFECARVGLGMAHKGAVRLQALSHAAWFDPRSHAASAIENAMEEALDQRRSVVLPPLEGEAAGIAIAHRELAKGGAVCSVVLAGGAGLGAGVLYFERAAGQPFSAGEVQALEQMAQLAGPVLEAKHAAYRWIGGRTRLAQRALAERLRDPRRPALRAGVALALLALAGLTLVDTGWRISADAAIEGEQQRVIPAPFEGFIASAAVKAGLVVRRGQPLAALDTRQIALDLQRWAAEEAQHGSRYRDALTRHDRPAAAMSMAQMQQAQAQRALAEDKLAKAAMTAPFDAFVVSGDLSQHIGSPVEQGKVLFELAPLDAYRVIVRVDERDIRAVRLGQRGLLVLSGLAEERLPFRVKNISVPEAFDGRNVFRVEAQLEPTRSPLRPGMQGVAKIEVGQRSLLWIWTRSAWNWLVLQAWKWSP
jgi:hypothetical protein